MPTSSLLVAPEVINLVEQVPHRAVLDVGPGWGKYSVLLREYLNDKPERVDAVEAWRPYIERHRLERLYDQVFHGDACLPLWYGPASIPVGSAGLLDRYDLVLMVDVIEHMAKEDALGLLDRIGGRVVICTPVAFFDNGPGLPPTEEHVSHWEQEDWDKIATERPVEVCHQSQGGWLVRLGPKATP